MTKFNIGFVQHPVINPGLDIRSKLLRNELSIEQLDEDARNVLRMLYAQAFYKTNLHLCKVQYALGRCSKPDDRIAKEVKLVNSQARLNNLPDR